MPVYKEEKTNTWRAVYRYTDWTGERKQSQKRGFKTKREALAWEREQLNKATADLDMTFASFVEQYTADMKTRIKENTWATKDHIIRTKLLPYFGKLKMCSITAQQIITWQNELLNHRDEHGKRKEELAELEQSIERVQQQQVSIQAVEQIEAKPLPLSSKVAVDKEDFQNLVTAAQKFVVQEKQEGKLKKLLKDAKKTIADLKAKIESLVTELSAVKAELAQYKSVRAKLRTADLEQENDRLRSRLRTYEDVISRNNLWSYFSRHRGKTPTRDDVR